MLISGALAGGLGLNEVMGVQHRLLLDFPGGAGFVGHRGGAHGPQPPGWASFSPPCCLARCTRAARSCRSTCRGINRDMVVVIQGLVILSCGALENLFRAPLAQMFHVSLRRRDTVRSMNIAAGPTSGTSGLMAKPPKT